MRFQYLRGLILAAVVWVAPACGNELITSAVPSDEEFAGALAGANIVPPVTTTASGAIDMAIVLDTFLVFRVAVGALDSTTVARIHAGAAGDTGIALVTLFLGVACLNAQNQKINTTSPSCRAGYTGQLSEGQIKPSQLTAVPVGYGATPRARFDSLVTLMRNGNVYVQVSTRRNATGEIRGQIQSAP
jgi:hypothetical protein